MVQMKKRIKVAFKHFLVSLFIVSAIVFLLLQTLYGQSFDQLTDFWSIVFVILCVDVCLGPLVTFIVYSDQKSKSVMRMDILVIVIIQCLALVYGVFSLYKARPAWVVFNHDFFELVVSPDIDERNLDKAKPEFQKAKLLADWVGLDIPELTDEESSDLLFEAAIGGVTESMRPEYYVQLAEKKKEIIKTAEPINTAAQWVTDKDFRKINEKYKKVSGIGWLPLKSGDKYALVIISLSKGDILDVWPVSLREGNNAED